MNPARPRRFGPFVVGVLIGLIGGVLLAWLGVVSSPLASGSAPTKTAPPVAEEGKSTPAKDNVEDSAKSAQPQAEPVQSAQPQAELRCLQRKLARAEGREAVRQLAQEELAKGAPDLLSDPGYFIQLLRERGYSCSDAEINEAASKLE